MVLRSSAQWARLRVESEQLTDRAVEGVAYGLQGAEADGLGVAIFEDREIDSGHSHSLGEFHESHAAIVQERLEVACDPTDHTRPELSFWYAAPVLNTAARAARTTAT